jgi:hypothetical protein
MQFAVIYTNFVVMGNNWRYMEFHGVTWRYMVICLDEEGTRGLAKQIALAHI